MSDSKNTSYILNWVHALEITCNYTEALRAAGSFFRNYPTMSVSYNKHRVCNQDLLNMLGDLQDIAMRGGIIRDFSSHNLTNASSTNSSIMMGSKSPGRGSNNRASPRSSPSRSNSNQNSHQVTGGVCGENMITGKDSPGYEKEADYNWEIDITSRPRKHTSHEITCTKASFT